MCKFLILEINLKYYDFIVMNSIFFFFNPILLSTVQFLVMCDSFLDFEIPEFS